MPNDSPAFDSSAAKEILDGGPDRPRHHESHFNAGETVGDIVIGMSDGLTVPFALAAGLSGAIMQARLVVTAGFAEIAAGSIAMGLGGFLAARSQAEHYAAERRREEREVIEVPEVEAAEVAAAFVEYGLTLEQAAPVVAALRQNPTMWVNFMMRYELGLEKPQPGRAIRSALTIAGSYVVGGLVPLLPYILCHSAHQALVASCVLTLLALLLFGYIKGRFTGAVAWKSAIQTALIGGCAAAAAFAIAKVIGQA